MTYTGEIAQDGIIRYKKNSFRTVFIGYSDWEYESGSTFDGGNMPQLQPYMFEPMRTVAEGEMTYNKDSEDDDDRFGTFDLLVRIAI